MFSTSGVQHQHQPGNGTRTPDLLSEHQSSVPPTVDSSVARVPSATPKGALSRIEDLLESIVDAIGSGRELVIPYQSSRSSQNRTNAASLQRDGHQANAVRFPARTVQEAKRFGTS
jgi:meiotic recombination protein SPO11